MEKNTMVATRLALKTAELREIADDLKAGELSLEKVEFEMYKDVIIDEVFDILNDILRLAGFLRFIEIRRS